MSNRRKVPCAPTADGPAGTAEVGLSPDEVARLKWIRIGEFLDMVDDAPA